MFQPARRLPLRNACQADGIPARARVGTLPVVTVPAIDNNSGPRARGHALSMVR